MAVDTHNEIWTGRGGAHSEGFERTYTRTFRVTTTTNLDGALVVLADVRTPRLYSRYIGPNGEYDLGAFCVRVAPAQDPENPQVWEVTAEYSTVSRVSGQSGTLPTLGHGNFGTSGGATGTSPDNPILRPADEDWDFDTQMVPVTMDANRQAVRNSAGDPFDPPIEIERRTPVLKITRNELTYNPLNALQYIDHTNAQPFRGCPALSVLIRVLKGTRAYESGYLFYKVHYELHFAQEFVGFQDWKTRVLDQGYRALAAGVAVDVKDAVTGQRVAKPVLLDGAGDVLLPVTAAPVYRTYEFYPSVSFTPLNLG